MLSAVSHPMCHCNHRMPAMPVNIVSLSLRHIAHAYPRFSRSFACNVAQPDTPARARRRGLWPCAFGPRRRCRASCQGSLSAHRRAAPARHVCCCCCMLYDTCYGVCCTAYAMPSCAAGMQCGACGVEVACGARGIRRAPGHGKCHVYTIALHYTASVLYASGK